MVYPIHVSDVKFENHKNLLLMTDLAIIPCVMFISKMLTDLCAIRKNIGIKKVFADIVCNILVVKKYW